MECLSCAQRDFEEQVETAEVASWDTKNTALNAFELTDLQGRNWSLADLKGKVAFINVWATWCGPCREELPYVQKLTKQLKGRNDVVVLTLNTDEEVGKVEPFMKENKYPSRYFWARPTPTATALTAFRATG